MNVGPTLRMIPGQTTLPSFGAASANSSVVPAAEARSPGDPVPGNGIRGHVCANRERRRNRGGDACNREAHRQQETLPSIHSH
jgi:hypothetical protein